MNIVLRRWNNISENGFQNKEIKSLLALYSMLFEFNEIQSCVAILDLLKNQKTSRFSDVFRGYRKATSGCIELLEANKLHQMNLFYLHFIWHILPTTGSVHLKRKIERRINCILKSIQIGSIMHSLHQWIYGDMTVNTTTCCSTMRSVK